VQFGFDDFQLSMTAKSKRRKGRGDVRDSSRLGKRSAIVILDQIVDRITRNADRAIIVDLPIPHWHADGVPLFAAYQRAKVQGFSSALSHEGASYLDLQFSLGEDDFYDSVHPKPAAAVRLSHLVSEASIEWESLR
jgi:hypothetical protein